MVKGLQDTAAVMKKLKDDITWISNFWHKSNTSPNI